jgi:hypothetical protein
MKVFQIIASAILLTSLTALISSAADSLSSRDEISLNRIRNFHPDGGDERHDILVLQFPR